MVLSEEVSVLLLVLAAVDELMVVDDVEERRKSVVSRLFEVVEDDICEQVEYKVRYLNKVRDRNCIILASGV